MNDSMLRVGILGAGFISDYHVQAILRQEHCSLVAICDMNIPAAKKLANNRAGVAIYGDLDEMLDQAQLDVVHVLTQPDSHFLLTKKVIEAGCHAVIEKPVTVNSKQAFELKALAEEHGVKIAINHNFVFSRPFNALQDALKNGALGPLKSIRVVWKKPLPQMNFGPWDLWMLQEPGNILFETGSHTLSEVLAIIDEKPSIQRVGARLPKVLPSGSEFYRRWSIAAESNNISIQADLAFDQGYEQHFIEVEGMFAVAKADIENDVFTLEQPTGRAYDIERLRVNLKGGYTRIKQAIKTYMAYASSKLGTKSLGNPYEASMLCGIANCYTEILSSPERKESSIDYAIDIATTAEAIQALLPEKKEIAAEELPATPAFVRKAEKQTDILIVGASGFIGKHLLTALQKQKKTVRALVRHPSSLVGTPINDDCEVMIGDYRDDSVAASALDGVKTVFHLAVSHSNSLVDYLRLDSEPTLKFAKLCQERGIERFIYTGTIDSLNLAKKGKIKESDGVDRQIKRRNNYAHSKAITEAKLMDMHSKDSFPVVIMRPAIVLGKGGPITHLGVANWFGYGCCAYWGNGKNFIPTVLVDDVVKAFITAIDTPSIEGNTYNLSAESCISARDYVAEVEKALGSKIVANESSALKHYIDDSIKWLVKVVARHPDRKRIPSLKDWKCREQHASFDTTKAQTELNWQPVNDRNTIIEQGIRVPTKEFLAG